MTSFIRALRNEQFYPGTNISPPKIFSMKKSRAVSDVQTDLNALGAGVEVKEITTYRRQRQLGLNWLACTLTASVC